MKPGIELKIANTKETAFLLQDELNSIERGSVYVEDYKGQDSNGMAYTERGYFDKFNKPDGPFITTFYNGKILY